MPHLSLVSSIDFDGPRKRPIGFESLFGAQAARDALVGILGTVYGFDAAQLLATKLAACGDGRPCVSGACPICLRSDRIALLEAAVPFFAMHEKISVAVATPCFSYVVRPGHLFTYNYVRVFERETAGAWGLPRQSAMIGGASISLLNDTDRGQVWSFSFPLLLGLSAEMPEVDSRLSHPFVAARVISKERVADAISWCVQNPYCPTAGDHLISKHLGLAPRNSALRELPYPKLVELSLTLDDIGLRRRLFVKGTRRSWTRGGNYRLVTPLRRD